MKDGDDNISHLAQACLVLQRRLGRLAGRILSTAERFTKEVDAIAYELEQCHARLAGASGLAGVPTRQPSRAATPEHQVLEDQAAAGALGVEVKSRPGGGSLVRVDGRKWTALSPMPAELLRILIEPGHKAGDDGLLGWRSYQDIAARLSERVGRSVEPADVTQVVYKLRRAFRAAGENWFLIQTNRTRGVRFALRLEGTVKNG